MSIYLSVSEVTTLVTVSVTPLWDVMPCSLVQQPNCMVALPRWQ